MARAWRLLFVIVVPCLVPCLIAQQTQHRPDDKVELLDGRSQDHSMHEGHHGDGHSIPDKPMDTETQAKLLSDKEESEFNHHLAGFFVALGGAFILLQGALRNRWSLTKYIWPASFLLSGIFVFVWSDTELWPFGNRQWMEALQHNREVLQHKTFAILLLGLGCIEWLRLKGVLRTAWSGLVFPVLAIAGSVLLLFHQHESGMHGPNHMDLMMRIQSQHFRYAAVGIGIGLTKGLAELGTRGQKVFGRMWPLLMVALGFLLMFYRE